MLLTANNHCYDTKLVGFLRTLEIIRGKGLETLGTYTSADETKWTMVEINGIKIGIYNTQSRKNRRFPVETPVFPLCYAALNEDLGDGIYQVYVEIGGEIVPFVAVNSATGDYHR